MDILSSKQVPKVKLEEIDRNPFQPREEFNEAELEELTQSIKTHGILQPVILRKVDDRFQLIAGERRVRAARMAGLDEVPAIVAEVDGVDVAEIGLIENLQRKDLNCIEEGRAYEVLMVKFGMSQEAISDRVGKSRSRVANCMRLLTLSDDVIKALADGKLSEGHGKALLALEGDASQDDAMRRVIDGNLSVRQAEVMIRNILLDGKKKSPRKKKKQIEARFVDARIYMNSIKRALKEIRDTGGKADMIERETEDYLEITVRIPKGEESGVVEE